MPKYKDYDLQNIHLEKDIELCLEKYFYDRKYLTTDKKFTKKIIEYIDDYNKYEHFYPLSLTWEITSECNLRCSHCYYYNQKEKFDSINDLSTEQIMTILDDIIEMGVINIILTGGEALLRKDIFEIIHKIKANNISIKLSSNGVLITKEIAKRLSTLLNPEMDDIQISLDGACDLTHDKTRGKGNFNKTIQGIKNLVEFGIFPSINCTVTSNNVLELQALYKLAQEFKSKKISLTRITPCDDTHNNLVPSMNVLFHEISNVIKLEKLSNGPFLEMSAFGFNDFINYKILSKFLKKNVDLLKIISSRNLMCHRHDKINVNKNGKVYLCFPAADNDVCSLGDLKEETLINIWAKRCNNILFQTRNLNNILCNKCKYILFCKGGCPLNAYQKYGSIFAPDGNCALGETFIKNIHINNNDT